MHLKRMLKKLVLGYKADSESYITFLKRRGAEIGDNVRIFTPAQTYIDTQAPHLLHIGTDVVITGPVTILIHDYSPFVCARSHRNDERAAASMRPVYIGDNVFIGWCSTILPGAVIGENSIIGAGSVVSGVIEANSVYAGNPAKKKMEIEEFYNKRIERQEKEAFAVYESYVRSFNTIPSEKDFYGYESLWNNEKSAKCRYGSFKDFCNAAIKKTEEKN